MDLKPLSKPCLIFGLTILSPFLGCTNQFSMNFQVHGDGRSLALTRVVQELYTCYFTESVKIGAEDFDWQLCIPAIGQGKRVLAVVQDQAEAARSALKTKDYFVSTLRAMWNSRALDSDLVQVFTGESPAEKKLLNDFKSAKVFDISAFLPSFIAKVFNTRASFSGPNCYHSALAAAGLIDGERSRHVSSTEFELSLKRDFIKVDKPQFGDVVVYDAAKNRGHAAFYLFSGLIFHKKGFDQSYHYRITHLDHVLEIEPFERQPSSDSGNSGHLNPDPGFKTKDYYHPRSFCHYDRQLSGARLAFEPIIDLLEEATKTYGPKGTIGSTMGTLMVTLTNNMLSNASLSGGGQREKWALARLRSIHDQIDISIGQELYLSPFAEPALINRDFCFHNNQFMQQLIQAIISYQNPTLADSLSPKALQAIISSQLDPLDKAKCRFDLFKVLEERGTTRRVRRGSTIAPPPPHRSPPADFPHEPLHHTVYSTAISVICWNER